MSVAHIKQALNTVRHPLSSCLSLPPACYHDQAWWRHEMKCLFGKGWFAVGRVDQWQAPGDFEAINVANIPLVIIMGKDHKLRAMSNTCLHRSSQIMSGSGNCRAMVCPFHGWSYDATGQVISAPRMETAECFSENEHQLKPFNVAVQDGFVFLSLQDNPEPLHQWLGDFSDLHRAWSFNDLATSRRRSFAVDCNWKLFIEVFNEYYHLPYVHPDSIGGLYSEPDAADDVIGQYTSQFGRTSGNAALLEVAQQQGRSLPVIKSLDEIRRKGTRYTWVYPNMTFAASSDCLWMYHVYPLSGASTRVVQTVCFPSATIARRDFKAKSAEYYKRFDLAIDEDIPALEKQQTGMQSPYAVQGRFSALEPSVGNFACWYSEATRK
ncbi:aromatic ring-hydroxylating oxygenase subunit alpha [Candidatus Spongiihabitans sp.]|uniref:aromatic ring-hydroxylating oxygenase subunit alpha n=1 Tax=Candidatus Spongiihabitans sp. TaxID=3101308 RepID=UPI003C7D6B4C